MSPVLRLLPELPGPDHVLVCPLRIKPGLPPSKCLHTSRQCFQIPNTDIDEELCEISLPPRFLVLGAKG